MHFKALTNNLKVFSYIRMWTYSCHLCNKFFFYVHAVCSHKLQKNVCAFPTGLHSFNFQIQVKSPCVKYILYCASNFRNNYCMHIGGCLPFHLTMEESQFLQCYVDFKTHDDGHSPENK